MTAYVFRISLDCPHCRTGVPVNGFTHEILCHNCFQPIELSQDWWTENLSEDLIQEALDHEPGEGNKISSLGGMNETVECGNRPPRCQKCKHEFPDALITGAESAGGFSCPGCKQPVSVRAATPLALSIVPDAWLLVNETGVGDNLKQEPVAATEPVMFPCLSCGAGLPVDGSSRTPRCKHCDTPNYLPDALWLRLHPAPISQAFFATIRPEKARSSTTLEPEAHITATRARTLLKEKKLEEDVIIRIIDAMVEQDEDDVLILMAKHPGMTETALLRLADDEMYYQVRAAVAKRAVLPASVLHILAQDDDSDVCEALAKRDDVYNLPRELQEPLLNRLSESELYKAMMRKDFPEWKLYEMCDNQTPDSAERILRAPNVTKRCLQRLGSNPYSHSVIKKHPIYQQQGFFGKLFFFFGS